MNTTPARRLRFLRRLLALLVVLHLPGAALGAQACNLPLGHRLRATPYGIGATAVEGRTVAAGRDSLALRPRLGPVRRMALSDLRVVERFDGRDRASGATTATLYGFLAGAAAGYIVWGAFFLMSGGTIESNANHVALSGGLVGAGLFAVLGFVIGEERWAPVYCGR